jgi:hypothetical protein
MTTTDLEKRIDEVLEQERTRGPSPLALWLGSEGLSGGLSYP